MGISRVWLQQQLHYPAKKLVALENSCSPCDRLLGDYVLEVCDLAEERISQLVATIVNDSREHIGVALYRCNRDMWAMEPAMHPFYTAHYHYLVDTALARIPLWKKVTPVLFDADKFADFFAEQNFGSKSEALDQWLSAQLTIND